MDKNKKNEFSMRITQGNKSEIIVVVYEIFFSYLDDARQAIKDQDDVALAEGARRASSAVEHLKNSLDFKYDLANELYPLYVFTQKALTRAVYRRDESELDSARAVMQPLSEAFVEVAKQDTSKSLMQNGESIVAGYTYGRNSLNEASATYDKNRGFLA